MTRATDLLLRLGCLGLVVFAPQLGGCGTDTAVGQLAPDAPPSEGSDETPPEGDDTPGDPTPPTPDDSPRDTPDEEDDNAEGSDEEDEEEEEDGDDETDEEPPTEGSETPVPVVPDCPVARAPSVYLEDLVPSDWRDETFARCAPTAHRFVMPAGSTWRFDVERLPTGGRLFVYGASYHRLDAGLLAPDALAASEHARAGVTTSVRVSATTSGEHVLRLERDDLREALPYQIRAVCESGCDREATRFPIFFVHGYAGVDSYFGVLDYFYGINRLLGDRGYHVSFPVTSPIARSESRADQLAEQVHAVLETTGARQVNFIAHSQGGLDVRVLSHRDDFEGRIASITTVATPHRGIPLLAAEFISVQDFSPEAMVTFNLAYPDLPEIRYFSWSARTCGMLERACRRSNNDESVDAFLVVPYRLLSRHGANDGIVPTASMPWGEHLGELSADHFDEIGQVADRNGDPFDHRAFYLREVRRLRDAGW